MENIAFLKPVLGILAAMVYLLSLLLKSKKGKLSSRQGYLAIMVVAILLWSVYELYLKLF